MNQDKAQKDAEYRNAVLESAALRPGQFLETVGLGFYEGGLSRVGQVAQLGWRQLSAENSKEIVASDVRRKVCELNLRRLLRLLTSSNEHCPRPGDLAYCDVKSDPQHAEKN